MTWPVRNRCRPIVAPLRSLVQIHNDGHSAAVYLADLPPSSQRKMKGALNTLTAIITDDG